MRQLIMWNMTTLNGLFTGPGGEIDWFVFDDELEAYIHETQRSADTLLFGRVTYELMAAYWPTAEGRIADFMNGVAKVVVSRSLTEATWNNTRPIKDHVADEVARLKRAPGKDIFVFGSADLSATLIRHGLFDEYRIGVNPVVLASGKPLFKDGFERLDLKLAEARTLKSGVVILHYRPGA